MSEGLRIPDAVAEHEETKSWQCESCDKMIEENSKYEHHCQYCGDYWKDVSNGLWDRDFYA